MHYPLTDIQAEFKINRPVRYQITTNINYFHRRQTDNRYFVFEKKGKKSMKKGSLQCLTNGTFIMSLNMVHVIIIIFIKESYHLPSQ